jgi:hypothetical protein
VTILRRIPWWAWASLGAGVVLFGAFLSLRNNPVGPLLMLAGGGGGAEAVKRRAGRARSASRRSPLPPVPQPVEPPEKRNLEWSDERTAARPRPGAR